MWTFVFDSSRLGDLYCGRLQSDKRPAQRSRMVAAKKEPDRAKRTDVLDGGGVTRHDRGARDPATLDGKPIHSFTAQNSHTSGLCVTLSALPAGDMRRRNPR